MAESSQKLFPWLLYYHGKNYKQKTLCNIAASSTSHKFPSFHEPKLKRNTVLGFSHGWFILTSDFYYLSMWNPITLESIDLPPYPTLNPNHKFSCFILSSPLVLSDDHSNVRLFLFEYTIPAIFFCIPSYPKSQWIGLKYDLVIDDIVQYYQEFPVIDVPYADYEEDEAGAEDQVDEVDKSKTIEKRHLESPVCCNGTLFGIAGKKLFRVEIELDTNYTISILPITKLPLVQAPNSYVTHKNLVECCGELYIIYSTETGAYSSVGWKEIIAISVYKLNFTEMIWEKVDKIDDHAFFLSKNYSISCPAPSLSNFPAQKNHIYFTSYYDNHKNLYSYHVEDGTLTMSQSFQDSLPLSRPPIWIMLPMHRTNVGEKRQQTSQALMFASERKDSKRDFFPWTNIPRDLQNIIAEKLPPFDYMNFRAVSKENCLIAPPIHWRNKFAQPDQSDQHNLLSPCLIYSPIGKNVCNFLDPGLNGRYLVNLPSYFEDPIVRYSKGSWLLMSSSTMTDYLPLSLFLFNPFTKAAVNLPEIAPFSYIAFGFSSLPYSSDDCFVVFFAYLPQTAYFFVASLEMEMYDILQFANETDFHPNDASPVFVNGSFYYLGEDERLGVLTKTEQGWDWQVLDVWGVPKDFYRNYLVECDGELLSVFVGHSGKWVEVLKLSRDTLFSRWEPVLDLGKNVLYLSRLSTICKVAQVEGTENRIYLERQYREKAMYYSLTTKKFHSGDGKESLTNFCNTSEPFLCAWIEPSWC